MLVNRTLMFAFVACLLVASASFAQESAQKSAVNDSLFAAAAADSGMAELTLSQLGLERATNSELKQFSQKMIADHTRLNQELMSVAGQKGIPLSRTADARAQFCAQSLAGLSGEEFDRCYSKAQFLAHMEAVAAFEAEAERGLDRDLKALAAKALPILKGHLAMIKPIAMRYEKNDPSAEK